MGAMPWREALVLRRHPRAKHVRLKIHPAGRVEVVVPPGFDERGLPTILDQHSAWVEERLLHFRDQPTRRLERPTTIVLPAIEQEWQLDYQLPSGRRNSCRESRDHRLTVCAFHPEQQRELIKRWLARKAKHTLIPWLEQTSDELDLPCSGVSVRGQRTRWGSCSAKGHINLNYGLLFLHPDLVRYLFVHELCHTIHLNHSKHYWALVESVEPHYKLMEKALKKAGKEVPAWLHFPFSEG